MSFGKDGLTVLRSLVRLVWLEYLRRKDVYVLLVLLVSLLFALLSVDIFGLGGSVRYVLDAGLLLTWVFSLILVVNLTARQLPREEERGTIYPLLAKPVSRRMLLVGKWLGCWSASCFAALLFYLLLVVVAIGHRAFLPFPVLSQAVLLHFAALAWISALALALSTRLTYGAAASLSYVIVAACALVVPNVPALAMERAGMGRTGLLVLYYLLPHLEVFDMRRRLVHGWGAAPWNVVGAVAFYGLLLLAMFLLLAFIGYRRKYFSRETRA